MGFRGEALASVAAVAQVELKTRRACDEVGTHLSIAGSKVTSQEPCSCPEGSNFNVENLFFNVPARRKFLKGNSTELKNIITAFERIALVYPDVSFALYSNGAEMFSLKAGALRQRIVDVVGKRFNQYLLPLKFDTTICKLSGFVGKPESARKKNAHNIRIKNTRCGLKRVHGRIDSKRRDFSAQHGSGVKMRERGRWRRVSQVIGRHINRLNGSYGSILGGCDAFLHLAHLRCQGRLISHGGRHTSKKSRYFRTCLGKTENIVYKEQNILRTVSTVAVTERLRHGQS